MICIPSKDWSAKRQIVWRQIRKMSPIEPHTRTQTNKARQTANDNFEWKRNERAFIDRCRTETDDKTILLIS